MGIDSNTESWRTPRPILTYIWSKPFFVQIKTWLFLMGGLNLNRSRFYKIIYRAYNNYDDPKYVLDANLD